MRKFPISIPLWKNKSVSDIIKKEFLFDRLTYKFSKFLNPWFLSKYSNQKIPIFDPLFDRSILILFYRFETFFRERFQPIQKVHKLKSCSHLSCRVTHWFWTGEGGGHSDELSRLKPSSVEDCTPKKDLLKLKQDPSIIDLCLMKTTI